MSCVSRPLEHHYYPCDKCNHRCWSTLWRESSANYRKIFAAYTSEKPPQGLGPGAVCIHSNTGWSVPVVCHIPSLASWRKWVYVALGPRGHCGFRRRRPWSVWTRLHQITSRFLRRGDRSLICSLLLIGQDEMRFMICLPLSVPFNHLGSDSLPQPVLA